MTKTNSNKIVSVLTILAMIVALATVFAVGVFAEGAVEAQWGTDAENLTNSGTLQEALNQVATDASITYIKVMKDIDLGTESLAVIGGAFTLDLNGNTVTCSEDVLVLHNSVNITITDGAEGGMLESTGETYGAIRMGDTSAVQLKITGGTISGKINAIALHSSGNTTEAVLIVEDGTMISESGSAVMAFGASATVTGGTFTSNNLNTADIHWDNGTLNLSGHTNPAGISVLNLTDTEQQLTLADGYIFYDEDGNKVYGDLANNTTYTIDVTKYKVTLNVGENGSATLSPADTWLAPGTEVTLTAVSSEGYKAEATVTGTTFNAGTNTFVVGDADVTVDVAFASCEAQWGTDAENLTGSGTVEEALAAAATDANIKYIKLTSDILYEENIGATVSGGDFTLDLNGNTIQSANYYALDIYNTNPVNLVVTDTKGGGALIGVAAIKAWYSAANVTVTGGTLQGTVAAILIDQENEASSLTITGGTLQGPSAICTSVDTVITGGILNGDTQDIIWYEGTLDLSGYTNPTGITLENNTGIEQPITLADGYSFYNKESGERVDGALADDSIYTVDVTKYKVTLNVGENGSATLSPSDIWLVPDTEVILTVNSNDGYKPNISVMGATFDAETNSFVVGNSDVTVDVTFRLYQAEWGTDKDTLTAWGTLEEAFDAAATDASITYIKVMNNFDIGNDPYFVEGGKFILDLNGKTVTSAGHVLYLKNAVDITITDTSAEQTGKIESTTLDEVILVHDTSAINITIEGGTLSSAGRVIVAHSAFGEVLTVNLTIKGGTLQTAINEHIWWGSTGVLDLSDYANPTGITVNNFSGAEPNITLPAGYSFYDKKGNRVDGAFENVLYTIDEAQYQLSWDIGNGINGESSSFSHGNEMLVWCTPVSFTLVLLDHYELVSVALNGEALEPDAETGVYSFVMPEDDVTVTVQAKYAPFVWGNTSDAMTNTGDFFELVAAINAGQAPYAKLLADYDVELLESDVTVSGKSHIDFGEYYLNVYNAAVILGEGADITFFGDQKVDDINADCNVFGSFELQVGSKLTISGTAFWGEIFYNGGTLDISDAHLTTSCYLYNLTDAEITIADVVTFAAPFRAFDPAWYNDPNYEGYTVPTVTTLAARVENIASAYIEAVFTVTFDFGKGSGTMPTFEHTFDSRWESFPTPEGLSHPDGLTLIGWVYEGDGYEIFDCDYIFPPELTDATIKAKWGAPLYVGGVGMNDGDYLASGATDTTKSRPTTGGYAYYKNGVLTLNNYQFSGDGFAHEDRGYDGYKSYSLIYSTTDLVIELVGSSNLVGTAVLYEEDYDYYFDADTDGIRVNGDLTVRGKGSLNIKVEDDGFYIEDLIFESGTVTIASDDEAIESDSITVLGGVLITVSEDGVDSDVVTVTDGEFHVLPEAEEYEEDDVELDTQTLTVTGGKLVVKGYYGIYADYVTISGGVVEVEAENSGAISPWDSDSKDAFVNISGGKVTLSSEYGDAICSTGDVTISGGEVTLYGDYGIYADGNVTVTGGELEIEAYEDAIYAEGDVTISGGDIYIYSYEDNGIGAYGNITISGGDVVISVGDGYAIEAYGGETAVTINGGFIHLMGHICVTETTTVTFGGKATQIFIEGDIIATISPVITEGEIKHIFTVDGTSYYEGVEISHNWTDAYQTDETHHYHICTDEDCVIRYFYLPESYYQYFEGANYGGHTVPEGEAACSVCGYGAEVPEEEIPEDAVLLVGDHYLKIGEYLTFDSDGTPIVVTEKPATGGYLYATVGTIEDTPVVTIVLSNFSFEYIGAAAIVALQDNMYIMQLEGENTITAHADKNYDALYPDAFVNGAGIGAMGSQLVIAGEGSLTINAKVGVFGFDSSFAVQNGATVTINAQQDGIEIQNGVFAVADATLTVNAGVDGLDISNGKVILAAASRVFVTAGDDGFALNYADLLATNATVTVVAVDDAVDADGCYIEWENSTFDLTADDHGITVYADSEGEYAFFVTDSILNIEAGDDGIRIYGYPEVFFAGSILNITAEDAGLYFESTRVMFASQLGMILSLNSTPGTSGKASEVNINAKRNYLCDASVDVYEIKLNVVVTETAFALDYASLYFVGSEISIVSRDTGIYSEYEADVNVYDSTLSIEAARYGINGYLYLDIRGEMVDVSVRAFEAIYCDSISLDEDYPYMMNAYFDGYTFRDENDDIASYVTIRGYAVLNAEMEEAIEKLDQLLSENGEFDAIANSIADVNNLLDALTNAEGEGRLDLVEKANEAINKALATLEENLNKAQTNLQNAIDTKADAATVNQSIADLNKALGEAEVAYAVADKELGDKLTAAETTLNAAIAAVDKKVEDAKTELEAAIAAGDATLSSEVENLNKALDEAEAAYAAADKAIDDKLIAAQTTLDTAIKAVDKKLDDAKTALDKAIADGDAELEQKIADLNKALKDAEAANETADGEIKTNLNSRIEVAQTSLSAAITALQTELNSAKAELQQQNNSVDAILRDEIAILKAEMDEKNDKASAWQTATTVIAIVGLVCNAGLISALVIIESKKKILTPVIKSGFEKVTSKFKKPSATAQESKSDDTKGEE